jgi:hypothetical protein
LPLQVANKVARGLVVHDDVSNDVLEAGLHFGEAGAARHPSVHQAGEVPAGPPAFQNLQGRLLQA